MFLDLQKGYAKHHGRSRHDPHVYCKVFDPRSSLPAWRYFVAHQICTPQATCRGLVIGLTGLVGLLLWLGLTSPAWAFPDNLVLENFTGADNTTPPNGNWTNAVFVGASSGTLRIRSNAAATSSTGVDGEAYWNPTSFNADQEVYATITDVASNSFGQLYARLANIGANTTDGYRVEWADGTSAITTTDKIGLKAVGDQICLWFSDSRGAWTELTCRTDATYSAGGRIGLGVNNNATVGSMDDFGGAMWLPQRSFYNNRTEDG